jgi:hypothetical protein
VSARVGRGLRRAPGLVLVLFVAACSMDADEMWRVTSPDLRVDAVFVRIGGGGATVGFSYKLFIVPRGAKPGKSGENLLADKIGRVSAIWSQPRKLEIRYDRARIFSFANFWSSKEIDNFTYVIEVQLVPTGPSQLGDPSS